jgi:hypothetical protein
MRKALILTLLLGIVQTGLEKPAFGICRRADRDDSLYQNLVVTTCPFSGTFYNSTSGVYGSAVLISPNWILTAKHAIGSGSMNFIPHNGSGSPWYGVSESHTNSSYDIAVCKLATPVTSIEPVDLYSVDTYGSEIGRECYISGSGMPGTGATGMTSGYWVRRAAQTYVMANATSRGWGDGLLTNFRDPATNSKAANLEGMGVSGDSGGGLYLTVGGELAVAGIQSYSYYNHATMGYYGDGAGYMRTGTAGMLNWIQTYATDAQIVGVPEPSGFIMILIGLLVLCGSQRLRRN